MGAVRVDPHRPADRGPLAVLRWLQVGQHGLFAALLLIGALRGAADSGRPLLVGVGSALLALWYVVGARLGRRRRDPVTGVAWLAALLAGWATLVLVSPDFSWLAFPLFFLCLHLLPQRSGLAVVVAMTAVVVVAQLATAEGNRVAQVLGPCVGAIVAVGMSAVYRRLVAENVERQRLVVELVAAQEDLVATHDALAAAQREAGALAERARLARDIHDTLAQGFSSIVLLARAGLAGQDVGRGESGDVASSPTTGGPDGSLLRQIEATASENLDEARRVVRALAPAALDQAPLPAALERLLVRMAEQVELATALRCDGDPVELPVSVDVALLRLAQGALANVRQHARASRVALTLTYATDEVRLDVADDGVGFDPDMVSPSVDGAGFGLRSMRERLADLGGALEIESVPGEGTAVAATVPLAAATHEPVRSAAPGTGLADGQRVGWRKDGGG